MSLKENFMLKETLPFPIEHINQYFDHRNAQLFKDYIGHIKVNKTMDKNWLKFVFEHGEEDALKVYWLNQAKALAYSHDFIECYRDVSGIPIRELVKKKSRKWVWQDYKHLTTNGGAK